MERQIEGERDGWSETRVEKEMKGERDGQRERRTERETYRE